MFGSLGGEEPLHTKAIKLRKKSSADFSSTCLSPYDSGFLGKLPTILIITLLVLPTKNLQEI